MAELTFKVETTKSRIYVGADDRPVQGFEVSFLIPELGEVLRTNVPSLEPDVVTAAIEPIVKARQALTEL